MAAFEVGVWLSHSDDDLEALVDRRIGVALEVFEATLIRAVQSVA